MQSTKSKIFNYLTKAQKSDICHYIASFVKKYPENSPETLVSKFAEDQKYYLEINSPRFPWIAEFIDDKEFLNDFELYVKECIRKYKYRESQKPLYEKQKAYLKEQRKKARENKMSKEPPTKAQISYYKKLCTRHNVKESLNKENASKLDLRDAIDDILKRFEASDRELMIEKLSNIKKC